MKVSYSYSKVRFKLNVKVAEVQEGWIVTLSLLRHSVTGLATEEGTPRSPVVAKANLYVMRLIIDHTLCLSVLIVTTFGDPIGLRRRGSVLSHYNTFQKPSSRLRARYELPSSSPLAGFDSTASRIPLSPFVQRQRQQKAGDEPSAPVYLNWKDSDENSKLVNQTLPLNYKHLMKLDMLQFNNTVNQLSVGNEVQELQKASDEDESKTMSQGKSTERHPVYVHNQESTPSPEIYAQAEGISNLGIFEGMPRSLDISFPLDLNKGTNQPSEGKISTYPEHHQGRSVSGTKVYPTHERISRIYPVRYYEEYENDLDQHYGNGETYEDDVINDYSENTSNKEMSSVTETTTTPTSPSPETKDSDNPLNFLNLAGTDFQPGRLVNIFFGLIFMAFMIVIHGYILWVGGIAYLPGTRSGISAWEMQEDALLDATLSVLRGINHWRATTQLN